MNLEQLYGHAQQLLAQKNHDEAYKILKKLNKDVPNHPGILYLIGVCQSLSGRKESAIQTYLAVLKIKPEFVEVMNNIGLDLKSLGRNNDALVYFDKATSIQPGFLDAKLNKSTTLLTLRRNTEALKLLTDLEKTDPENPKVLANLGLAYLKIENPDAALLKFSKANSILTNDLDIARGYFVTLCELKNWGKVLELSADLPPTIFNDPVIKNCIFGAHLQDCNWNGLDKFIENAVLYSSPFNALYAIEDPDILLKISTLASEKSNILHLSAPRANKKSKLKIGYISPDFKTHPVSFLVSGIFNNHNSTDFEIYGIAIDKPPHLYDAYRTRISESCHRFLELGNADDHTLSIQLKDLNLDILIDLNGHTNDNRTSILSNRCAPIQIQYLGFPGTMGSKHIDYTIGDSIITPQSHFKYYSEKIITLPECFQANDDLRTPSEPTSKMAHHLPNNAFVFASFNQNAKYNPLIFDSWMRILYSVPESVIWLSPGSISQISNLKKHASKHGIDPQRLIFADPLPYADHLSRYLFVDLALDTYPFNGGTTTSDALWCGTPVLTLLGNAYSSRMSASLLFGLKLDTLVTSTIFEYEALAIQLAKNQNQLDLIRLNLKSNRLTMPPFNSKRFTRHFELGLQMALERSKQGLNPEHIFVPRFDDVFKN